MSPASQILDTLFNARYDLYMIAQCTPTQVVRPVIPATILLLLGVSVGATEVDFWRPYAGPDEATYLLATFDDDAAPGGTAKVERTEKIGSPARASGKFGRALQLDGHSGLQLSSAGVFLGGDLAIEAWIRLDDYPQQHAFILHRPAQVDQSPQYDPQRDVTKGFSLWLDHHGGLHLETVNCFYGAAVRTSSPAGAVPKGRWVHVAATSNTFPNNYRRLFVDGREVASAAVTWGKGLVVHGDEESKSAKIFVGIDAKGENGLVGRIDQLRVHRQIARFWPNEEEPWTRTNVPGQLPDGPPHFLSRHAPAFYFPLDGTKAAYGSASEGMQILGGEKFVEGVCGQALVGKLELRGTDVLDLREGTIEFWLRPVGVNSYSDRNYGLVGGPFVFYIFNSGGLANKPLALYFPKDDGELLMLRAEDTQLHPGRWYHFAITWRDDEISVFGDGRRLAKSFGVPLVTIHNRGVCRQFVLGAGESLLDEVRVYRHALEPEEVANAYFRYRDRTRLVSAVDRPVRLRAQYYPSQKRLFYRLASNVPEREIAKVVLRLRDPTGNVLQTSEHPWTTDEQMLDLPSLPDGRYELTASAVHVDGSERSGEPFKFRRHHFSWEGNRLGITDEVFPPFEPIRVAGRTLDVVDRRYRLGPLGLPEQITSNGRDLLAAPISLRYETEAGEGRWSNSTGELGTVQPHQAVFEGQAEAPVVQVRTRGTIEIDGCMKVEMDLLPGEHPAEIQRLWLEIPLRAETVPLMHTVTAGLRQNYSGVLPSGTGVVWDGSQAHQYQRWLNAFVPYIWLGSPNRGLAWFAENDRGWITRKTPDARLQEIVRDTNRVVLRVYLVNRPTTIRKPHHLVFGLQASPTKPMPSDWRARVADAPGGLAVVPWGGLACASQAPYRDDWRIADKILEPRHGKPFDAAWFERYNHEQHPPDAHGTWPWLDAVSHFAGRARNCGIKKPLAVYQEEMRGCDARPEWCVFQDEWTTQSNRYDRSDVPERVFARGYEAHGQPQRITFPRTYQDFGCWIADQWLRRGVSLYWDNTYPYASTNTRTTAAYVADDGRVQPCMIIWNHREYTKRAWHLLQYWRRQRSEPLEFTLHMTNTLLLPVHTWGTVNLDHELGAKRPFRPEWLMTETIGRQVGSLPLSLYAVAGSENEIVKSLPAEQRERIEWGLRAVHEIQRSGPQEERLTDFGYGKEEVTVHNYWDDRPVLTVEPATVKWLVLAKPESGEAMVVLTNWSESAVTARVKVDPAQLHLDAAQVTDHESGASLAESVTSTIKVDLPGPWGNRILSLGP